MLNSELASIEKENYFYKPKQAQEINRLLDFIDTDIINLVNYFKVLKKYYSNESFLIRKNFLLKLGFNIFRHPAMAQMLVVNWPIIKVC